MNKSIRWAAAAALAIGGVCFAQQDTNQQKPGIQKPQGQNQGQGQARQGDQKQQGQAGQQSPVIVERIVIWGVLVPDGQSTNLPQGFTQTEVSESGNIRRVFTKAADAILQKGQHQKLLDCLVEADRKRLQDQFGKADFKQFEEALAGFDKAWQQKYNKPLDVSTQSVAFGQRAKIFQGEVNDPKLLANWPVENQSGGAQQQQQQGQQGGGQQQGAQQNQPAKQGNAAQGSQKGDANQQGNQQAGAGGQGNAGQQGNRQQAAVVILPATVGLPETYVSLLSEGGQWKIDIPDDVDGNKLSQNLNRQLQFLNQHAKELPQEDGRGYAMVAHHVMLALYDQDIRKGQGDGGQGAQGQGGGQNQGKAGGGNQGQGGNKQQ